MKRYFIAVILMLVLATPALAQTPPPLAPPAVAPATSAGPSSAAPPPAKTGTRNTGIMASLSFGVNGCTDDQCDSIDPMVYVRLQGLYRLIQYFAAGLHLSLNFLNPDTDGDVDASVWQLFIGPEARGIYPLGKVDLWSAVALGYVRTMSKASYAGYSMSTWFHGFAIGWGLGAQYYVTPKIAVGADFWLYKPLYTKGCYTEGDYETCDDIDLDDQDGVGITWAFGITATFWLGK